MPVQCFNHYNLRAQRALLNTLRDFYVTVVGLELGVRPLFPSFGYWLYAGGRDIVHLTEAPANEQRPVDGISTFDHVAFLCSDAKAFRLASNGIEYTCDEVPLTGELQLFFKDPAGNGVELSFPVGDA